MATRPHVDPASADPRTAPPGKTGSGTAPQAGIRAVRRRLSVDKRREQLIGVALDLFSKHPPEDVSIDDIAAAAGASRPLVYHYFPGKQALYEAALNLAGHELAGRFEEPATGPLSERLNRVMGRYLDFVDRHGPGFSALLRGGSVAASPGANAVIDEVRRAAHDQILSHLGVPEPSARLRLTIRCWIANAEITALEWLTDRSAPREVVQMRLVQEFVAALVVAASYEPGLVPSLAEFLADEPPEAPTGRLVQQLAALFSDPELGRAVGRLALGIAPTPAPTPAPATATATATATAPGDASDGPTGG